MPATTALKAPAKLAASAQPLSPPIKSTAAPKSPVVATIKPGAPPPLKPLDHVPTEQPAVVSKQPAAAAPQPAKPALAAITKQQAPTPAKAAVEEKEEEDDEEDYYDEDFDEEAATIDEEETRTRPTTSTRTASRSQTHLAQQPHTNTQSIAHTVLYLHAAYTATGSAGVHSAGSYHTGGYATQCTVSCIQLAVTTHCYTATWSNKGTSGEWSGSGGGGAACGVTVGEAGEGWTDTC